MNFLEERIVKDGIVKEGNVLKVDSFLNHQMDIDLFNQMGEEFKKRFEGKNINKIVTIEASGIGIACVVAQHFVFWAWRELQLSTIDAGAIREHPEALDDVRLGRNCRHHIVDSGLEVIGFPGLQECWALDGCASRKRVDRLDAHGFLHVRCWIVGGINRSTSHLNGEILDLFGGKREA